MANDIKLLVSPINGLQKGGLSREKRNVIIECTEWFDSWLLINFLFLPSTQSLHRWVREHSGQVAGREMMLGSATRFCTLQGFGGLLVTVCRTPSSEHCCHYYHRVLMTLMTARDLHYQACGLYRSLIEGLVRVIGPSLEIPATPSHTSKTLYLMLP